MSLCHQRFQAAKHTEGDKGSLAAGRVEFKPTPVLHLEHNIIQSCSLRWHDENQCQLLFLLEESDSGTLSAVNRRQLPREAASFSRAPTGPRCPGSTYSKMRYLAFDLLFCLDAICTEPESQRGHQHSCQKQREFFLLVQNNKIILTLTVNPTHTVASIKLCFLLSV